MVGWPENMNPPHKEFSSLQNLLDKTLIERRNKKKSLSVASNFYNIKKRLVDLRNKLEVIGAWESAITIDIILEQDLKGFLESVRKELNDAKAQPSEGGSE